MTNARDNDTSVAEMRGWRSTRQRLTALLMDADLNFSEFDDVTIRRIVECIQVNTDKHILVTLKGGLQGEELI